MTSKTNKSIKCEVENCKYQNNDKCECELEEIKVVCNCSEDDCCCSSDTSCASYDCKYEDEVEED